MERADSWRPLRTTWSTLTGIAIVLLGVTSGRFASADEKPESKQAAADGAASAAPVQLITALTGLNQPLGLAVQPETDAVYIAESGAGRVVRLAGDKADPVISDFPVEKPADGPFGPVGPTSLVFFDKTQLFVGEGAKPAGGDLVRHYKIAEANQPALKFNASEQQFGPLNAEASFAADGGFFGLTATKFAIYAGCTGDAKKGWIARSVLNGGKWTELRRFVATQDAIDSVGPHAATTSPRGEIVLGLRGQWSDETDSQIAFLNSNTGRLLLTQPAGLRDVVGVAFSPKTSQLYVVDLSASKPSEGGLFRLDSARTDKGLTIKATKIAAIERPTALAFNSDGTLFVASLGPAVAADAKPNGHLFRVPPGL